MLLKIWIAIALCFCSITFISYFEKSHIQKYDPYLLKNKTCGEVYKENYSCWLTYERSNGDKVVEYVNKIQFNDHYINEIYIQKSLYVGYSKGFFMWCKIASLVIVFIVFLIM